MCMKWSKIKPYVISVLIPLGVGVLSGFLTRDGIQAFALVEKPPLTPPAPLFPIVWSILYILMGIGAAMVFQTDHPKRPTALTVYAVQLIVNFFWSLFFFNLQQYAFSFFWLLLLWLLIVVMIRLFYQIKPIAGLLQLPYLLWVTFAGYLTFGVWMLNR